MTISDFQMPNGHPFGMLDGLTNACEKEAVLTMILSRCIDAGGFIPIKTKFSHPAMVSDGLLSETPEGYLLTKKAKGLLYAHFGKEETEGQS